MDNSKKFFFPNESNYSAGMNDYQSSLNPYENEEIKEEVKEDDEYNFINTQKKIMSYAPARYDDVQTIATDILNDNPVIINLENLLNDEQKRSTATRIIDYICGVAFAKNIKVLKINTATFLINKETN